MLPVRALRAILLTAAALAAAGADAGTVDVRLGPSPCYLTGSSFACLTGSSTLTFPSGAGSNGQVLSTDGAGNLSWASGGGGGSGITALTGDVTASGTGSVAATVALVGGQTAQAVSAAAVAVAAATASATASTVVKRDSAGNAAFTTATAGAVAFVSNGHKETLTVSGSLAADAQLELPATQGTIGQLLTSGGPGPMSWSPAGLSQATLNTTMEQLTSHRKANIVCASDTTLNGSQTCDGVSTQASEVVAVLGNADPTEDGLYLENDFGAWPRTLDVSGVGDIRASLIAVDAQGGGTAYSNALIFTYGDGGSTQVIDRVPHGCAAQTNSCTSATTCAVTCSTAVNTPVMTGGGCQSTANLTGNYPSAATTWTCTGASGNLTASAICCN